MAETNLFDQTFQGLTYHQIFRDLLNRVLKLKKNHPELNQMIISEDSCKSCDFAYEYHVKRETAPGKGGMGVIQPQPQPDGVYLSIKFLTAEEASISQQIRLYQHLGRANVLVEVISGKRESDLWNKVVDAIAAEGVRLNKGIIPRPDEVQKITTDPPSAPDAGRNPLPKAAKQPSEIILHALATYYPTTWDKALLTYSMVGFFQSGDIELKDGRSLKWKWNLGGVLRLDSPDGRDICLVPNDPNLP